MLTGAVIKAEQVLFPFGKMEIRKKRKKKKRNPEEEENPQERRVAFHRGIHKSWNRQQVLGVEEGWQGNRGSNKRENLRGQSARLKKGWAKQGISSSCSEWHSILYRPSVPVQEKNPKIWFCSVKKSRCDCEGGIGDQANMKWTLMGREDFRKMKQWGCSVPPEAPSEGLNWKGLGNIVVKSSEPFLRDPPEKDCAASFWDGELCWAGKWGRIKVAFSSLFLFLIKNLH